MSGLSKLRYMCWSDTNREIFAGNQTGKVTIWDIAKAESVFVHEAHENAITKMQWFEKSRYLMTSSKEKVMHVWQMPKTWIVEEEPNATRAEEESKFMKKKPAKPIEEVKIMKPDPFEEKQESIKIPVKKDNTAAFNNITKGFDPLGGGKFNQADFVEDDDLSGWHK